MFLGSKLFEVKRKGVRDDALIVMSQLTVGEIVEYMSVIMIMYELTVVPVK